MNANTRGALPLDGESTLRYPFECKSAPIYPAGLCLAAVQKLVITASVRPSQAPTTAWLCTSTRGRRSAPAR